MLVPFAQQQPQTPELVELCVIERDRQLRGARGQFRLPAGFVLVVRGHRLAD